LLEEEIATLRRATDFLRRRHRQMLLQPEEWLQRSCLSDPAEPAVDRISQLSASENPAATECSRVADALDTLNNTDAVEARAASLFAMIRSGISGGSGAVDRDAQAALRYFWSLTSALCIEERRRRLLCLHLRKVYDQSVAERREHASALAEERMRSSRAELALQNAVAHERALASRASAELRMSSTLAQARSEELRQMHQMAESRYGEVSKSLQASHSSGWRAMQQKLNMLEGEARQLRTRDAMWSQLCEKQRVLAHALRSHDGDTTTTAVAQMEAEVHAWEQSVLRSANVDSSAAEDATSDTACGVTEAEILRRVDEATAALSAEQVTLRSELSAAHSRAMQLAESNARLAAEKTTVLDELQHAQARCGTYENAAHQTFERLNKLELQGLELIKNPVGSSIMAWIEEIRAEEDSLNASLADAAPYREYAVPAVATNPTRDHEICLPLPSRQSSAAAVYVDSDEELALDGDEYDCEEEALEPARLRSALPTVALSDDDEGDSQSDEVQAVDESSLREIVCSLVVAGATKIVKLEVSDSDTPSSLAVELMEELHLSSSDKSTQNDLIRQIGDALKL